MGWLMACVSPQYSGLHVTQVFFTVTIHINSIAQMTAGTTEDESHDLTSIEEYLENEILYVALSQLRYHQAGCWP